MGIFGDLRDVFGSNLGIARERARSRVQKLQAESQALPAFPRAEASSGRHHRHHGASLKGTLSNWVSAVISSRIAEREKRKVADRARDLHLNDAMAHGIVEGAKLDTIGIGLSPQPQPMTKFLGFDAAWEEEYQQTAYDLWEIWGLDCRKFCDATRRQNIYLLMAMNYLCWQLDGIGIAQVRMMDRPFSPLPLCLLPIDPCRLETPTDAPTNEDVYDGLVLDSNGAPVFAYIRKPMKSGWSAYGTVKVSDCLRIPVWNELTGLPNLLLTYDVTNPAEYRQYSILGPMMKEHRDSHDLADAALVNAVTSNLLTVFFEDSQGTGGVTDPTDWNSRFVEFAAGTILRGAAFEKPHMLSSQSPGPNYDKLWESIIGRCGMSTLRGPENVTRKYDSSYSASQASMENSDKVADFERQVVVSCFGQPAFAWLQYLAAVKSLLTVKSIKHFAQNLYAYTRSDWLPPPARPIDKLKAAKSDESRLITHTTTLSKICGKQNENWKVVLRQRAKELQYIKALEGEFGISMATDTPPASTGDELPGDGKEQG